MTEANRLPRVGAARAEFDRVVQAQLDASGFADKLDRVAFVGFSQGSIMALDALVSGRWPVAALVAFFGRLASPEPLAPKPGARTLLIHGEADPVIPAEEAPRAGHSISS